MVEQIQNLYLEFLANFPAGVRPFASLFLAVLLAYAVFKIIKKEFIYLLILIILLPGSIPILKTIWEGVVGLVKFLISVK